MPSTTPAETARTLGRARREVKRPKVAIPPAGAVGAEAEDGRAGLAKIRETMPDLVITDIFMPEQEGIATILECRRLAVATKIVAISGSDDRLL